MKKTLLLISIILLTGCLSKSAQGYITKTCKKQENINKNKVDTIIEITSKTGTLETVTIKEIYSEKMNLESIINSKKSEQNNYKTEQGIDMYIDNNTFIYTIKPQEISETIKTRFNVKKELHEQIKEYETLGYECK